MRIPKELKAWLAEEPGKRRVLRRDRSTYLLAWDIGRKVSAYGYWEVGQCNPAEIGHDLLSQCYNETAKSLAFQRLAVAGKAREMRAIERKLKEVEG